MKIIDYELIEDASILFKSRIILYGTGFWAEKIFECMREAGICPSIVCETKVTKEYFHDLKVEPLPAVLREFDDDNYVLLIASINYYNDMIKLCSHTERIGICTLYGIYASFKMHIDEHMLPSDFEKKIEAGLSISQDLYLPKLKGSAINRFVQAALAPEDHIWIFQPGKVGSQSIWNSIQDKSIQFHTLTGAYRFRQDKREYLDYYLQLIQKKKVKIISAVREPISRDIAAFFQNSDLEFWPYHSFNCNIFSLYGRGENEDKYMDIREMRRRCPVWKKSLNQSFEDFTRSIMHYKMDLFSWFDFEIKSIFDIDVYQYPFDQRKGYSIIEKGNVRILILKMEYLSALQQVIADFIEDKNYKIIDRNKASEKIYQYAYDKFKRKVRFPSAYFDFYYSGNYKYEHFYSKDEIDISFRHWEKHVSKD